MTSMFNNENLFGGINGNYFGGMNENGFGGVSLNHFGGFNDHRFGGINEMHCGGIYVNHCDGISFGGVLNTGSSSDFSELARWCRAEGTDNLEKDQMAVICAGTGRLDRGIAAFFEKLRDRLGELKWSLSFQRTFAAFGNRKA